MTLISSGCRSSEVRPAVERLLFRDCLVSRNRHHGRDERAANKRGVCGKFRSGN